MKSSLAAAAALLFALTAAEAGQAQRTTAPARAAPWRTEIFVCRLDARPAGEPSEPAAPPDRTCFTPELGGLVLSEDVPVRLRQRRFAGKTVAHVDVAADGVPNGCRVTSSAGESRLDRIACDSIMRRGRFQPFYAAPGRPIASRWDISVGWDITDRPFVPTISPAWPPIAPVEAARPGGWPRLRWSNMFELAALPRIQSDFPSAARMDGVVSLDLVVTPERGIEGCVIGIGSGDSALDSAACRIARRVELRYPRPCRICAHDVVPLQVHWRRGGGSHIRFPLPRSSPPGVEAPPVVRDPADPRTISVWRPRTTLLPLALTWRDFRGLGDRKMTNTRLVALVDIDAAGRVTGCRIRRSTGNERVDRRACGLLIERARYQPRTDVFGDPLPTSRPIPHEMELRSLQD